MLVSYNIDTVIEIITKKKTTLFSTSASQITKTCGFIYIHTRRFAWNWSQIYNRTLLSSVGPAVGSTRIQMTALTLSSMDRHQTDAVSKNLRYQSDFKI